MITLYCHLQDSRIAFLPSLPPKLSLSLFLSSEVSDCSVAKLRPQLVGGELGEREFGRRITSLLLCSKYPNDPQDKACGLQVTQRFLWTSHGCGVPLLCNGKSGP